MSEKEIAQFLSSLASESHVSVSTQNQALNAILFLYREVLRKEIGYVDGVIRAKKSRRLRAGRVEAWASTRPALLEFSTQLSGSRVLEDCFGANFTAMVVPRAYPNGSSTSAISSKMLKRRVWCSAQSCILDGGASA